jgi:tape measure domain-containing protein
MANPVDILIGKKAIEDFDLLIAKTIKAQEEILKLGNDALLASKSISKINTPSGVNANSANASNITNSLNSQTQALQKLQIQKQKVARATAEETVNNGLLNRNAKEQVVINSRLSTSYERLNTQHKLASRNLQDLIVRGRQANQTQRQYNVELRNSQRDFSSLNKRILSADKAVGRFNRNVGNYPKALGGVRDLMAAFGIVGGVSLFVQLSKDIFDQTRRLQSLDLALSQVTKTQEEFVESQAFILRVSEQYGVGINELTKSYTQFYVSAKDKLSSNEIQGIFESISKAAGAMGLSVEQQDGAFLALTQMLSKGTIQAEELRGQLSERLPGAFVILAKSMGVTEAVLGDMLKKGQVMAAEVLPNFAKELEKAYGIENLQRVESLNAATTRLSNSFTNLIRSFTGEKGEGSLTKFFNFFVNGVTKTIEVLQIANEAAKVYFRSEEDSRKVFLESQKAIGESGAKKVLLQFKDSEEKTAYANEALIKTRAEIAKNKKEFERLKQENADIETKMTNARAINPNTTYSQEDRITLRVNKEKILSLNTLMYKQVGYVNGLKSVFEVEKKLNILTSENTKIVEKAKRDKIQDLKIEQQSSESLLDNLEEQIRLIKVLQQANSKTNEQFLFYQKSIDQLQRGIDLIKNGNDELQKSAEEGIKGLLKEDEMRKQQIQSLKDLKLATDEYIASFSNSFFNDAGLSSIETFFDGSFERLMEGADTLEKKFSVTFLAIAEVAQEAFSFISQVSQENFDAEYNRLELQKNVAIQFAGESTVAQEAINKEYDRRRAEIQTREARAQKELAIFNSIINTAQAIVSFLAKGQFGFAIAAGLVGAAQVAIIQSQQIPQFFEGGIHDGGMMLVNDGKGSNYKETIVTPDGKSINPTGRNVLMNAPKGTQIFNANQTEERDAYLRSFLQEKGISMSFKEQKNGLSAIEFNSGINRLERTMAQSSSSRISADRRGITLWKEENGRKTKVLNNRLHIK